MTQQRIDHSNKQVKSAKDKKRPERNSEAANLDDGTGASIPASASGPTSSTIVSSKGPSSSASSTSSVSTSSSTSTPREPKGFEAELRKLEDTVADLEGGDLPLEEALGLYERGVALTRHLQQTLADAEQKVKVLSEKEEG